MPANTGGGGGFSFGEAVELPQGQPDGPVAGGFSFGAAPDDEGVGLLFNAGDGGGEFGDGAYEGGEGPIEGGEGPMLSTDMSMVAMGMTQSQMLQVREGLRECAGAFVWVRAGASPSRV